MHNLPKQVKFYFFGDSICFGQHQSYAKTWIAQVDAALTSAYPDIEFIVQNPSVNGSTTEDARRRLNYHLLSHNPDFIWIQFGMNDANKYLDNKGENRVDVHKFSNNIEYILKESMKIDKNKRIFLATNHLVEKKYADESFGDFNDDIRLYNNSLRNLAQIYTEVQLVDIEREIPSNQLYLLPDGVHLNSLGHIIYSHIALKTINNRLKDDLIEI